MMESSLSRKLQGCQNCSTRLPICRAVIARIANHVPAISGVAPAAFPHVGAIEIGVHDLAAAHEVHDDGVLPPHAIEGSIVCGSRSAQLPPESM